MIENILILDTETTGLSPAKGDIIIEIAAVLFNIKHRSILQCFSTLLPCEENPVEHINQIKAEVTRVGYSLFNLDSIFIQLLEFSQACIAHNVLFDKKFIATLPFGSLFLDKKWICTQKNFSWPVKLDRFRLQDVCLAMDVPYLNAHRALSDCLLLAECFKKIEDLEERFARC